MQRALSYEDFLNEQELITGREFILYSIGRDEEESIQMMQKYIDQGGDINFKNSIGETAFDRACSNTITSKDPNKNLKIIKFLLENGVDVNTRMKGSSEYNNATRLMYFIINNNKNAIELFMNHPDVDVNIKNYYGQTALMLACNYGTIELVDELLEKGADINDQDKDGNTVLYYTQNSLLIPLLERGADETIKNNRGKTILEVLLSDDDRRYSDFDYQRKILSDTKLYRLKNKLNIDQNMHNKMNIF